MSEELLEQRFEIIKEIFNDDAVFNRSKNEVLVFCPKHDHHKRKLSVNVAKNNYKCWVCGYAGQKIFYLLRENATKDQQKRYIETLGMKFVDNKQEIAKLELPKEYKFALTNKNSPGGIMAMNYLSDINFDESVVLQNKIGFCESGQYANRIVFPSFDVNGKLNFFSTRRYDDGDYKKYLDCEIRKSEVIFNEIFIDWSKPVILVENIKASMRHGQLNVVPIMGSSLSSEGKIFQEIVLNGCDVYLALDPEAKKGSLKIADMFKSYCINCYIVDLPTQPDEMETGDFINCVNKATTMSFNDYFLKKLNIKEVS